MQNRPRIQLLGFFQAFRNVLFGMELRCEGGKTEYTACYEWENGVGAISDVVDAEPFAYDNICRVANEKDHTSCIRGSELSHEPRYRVELDSVGVIHQEGRAGKNNRVISTYHAQKRDHDIKIKVKFP